MMVKIKIFKATKITSKEIITIVKKLNFSLIVNWLNQIKINKVK